MLFNKFLFVEFTEITIDDACKMMQFMLRNGSKEKEEAENWNDN